MADTTVPIGRRAFLGLVAVVGGSATQAMSAAFHDREKPVLEPQQAADAYRETDHIRAAYERMRF